MSQNKQQKPLFYMFLVLGLHILSALCLFPIIQHNFSFIGLTMLAYSFGLRHAFDVDHIVAIDNTVRKLIRQKESSVGVGFYFSIGHSTVVFLLVFLLTLFTNIIERNMSQFQAVGGLIGSTVSGVFLVVVGLINLIILIEIIYSFIQKRHKKIEKKLGQRGFLYTLLF